MRYTPEFIIDLQEGEIMVYGSNQFGRHGAGSAKMAHEKFGAIMDDVPMGLIGRSCGIITVSFSDISVTFKFILYQVQVLYKFAELRSDLTFLVTKIGTGIAGFAIAQIASIFESLEYSRPSNIILPIEFSKN